MANRCNYVKKNNGGTFDDSGYTDFDDCYSKTLNLMTMSNIVVLTLINIVFLHFLLVVYKHYKNAGLPVVQGGCPKEQENVNNGGIQMNSIDDSTARGDISV